MALYPSLYISFDIIEISTRNNIRPPAIIKQRKVSFSAPIVRSINFALNIFIR